MASKNIQHGICTNADYVPVNIDYDYFSRHSEGGCVGFIGFVIFHTTFITGDLLPGGAPGNKSGTHTFE